MSIGLKRLLLIILLFVLTAGALLACIVETVGVPPRALAAYIEHRASGHNSIIYGVGEWLGMKLISLDRGQSDEQLNLNARLVRTVVRTGGHIVPVSTSEQAVGAIAQARPGDVITFLPGRYRFTGQYIGVSQPGTRTAGITVRAEQPGTVFLEFDMLEGFLVSAPYWTFENLNIIGVCREHSNCEHAFHVVAGAVNFSARNNYAIDFNAHLKINGAADKMPDDGLIEGNTLTNTRVRQTSNPVTPIDLVAASRWVVRRNLISDFIKGEGDGISYGAFAKGAGSDNRFEQNIVLCEHRLRGQSGQRVGLSLGGGGTSPQVCRDHRCITEQDGGVIQSNLIASCSDDGIYLNRAATSKILHNTLIDTGGIVVRFLESSADVEGNLVDGRIRSRNGGVLRAADNIDTSMTELYLGRHPVRRLYVNASGLNLAWNTEPPRRNVTTPDLHDLCGLRRPAQPVYGAFEDFRACFLPDLFASERH
ncbi:MAG: right-handed parallel beta-helix repeat-containing protein [Proteobacteria bacterium]|nr:right-handed parallel beta-helix repeat-containing protein [Pseudomonadota bacterium]